MFDKLKIYLVEVIVPKYIPMAVLGAFSWLGAYLVAHAGTFEPYGVTYGIWPLQMDASGPVILIELDTLKVKLIPILGALFTVLIAAIKHHSMAAVSGTPQSGDLRIAPETPMLGGQRAEDQHQGDGK